MKRKIIEPVEFEMKLEGRKAIVTVVSKDHDMTENMATKAVLIAISKVLIENDVHPTLCIDEILREMVVTNPEFLSSLMKVTKKAMLDIGFADVPISDRDFLQ